MTTKMIPPFLLLLLLLLLLLVGCSQAQQQYLNNAQLNCYQNPTNTLGYLCNGASTSCNSYLTFRSQPPSFNTPSSIATLLHSDPSHIARINNISSVSTPIPADTVLIVPVTNCSCAAHFYQHNASYVLRYPTDTYFSVANNTYEGLTTCQSLIAQNPYNFRHLAVGMNITIPLRCTCPTANQTASGIKYLLAYLVTIGDTYESIAKAFNVPNLQTLYDANQLDSQKLIFPFTPILVPLTTEPTGINTSALMITPTPPSSPTLPAVPSGGNTDGKSSHKWVYVGVGIAVALLLLLLLTGFFLFRSRGQKGQLAAAPEKTLPKSSPGGGEYTFMTTPGSNSWSVSSVAARYAAESLTVYKYAELEKATGFFQEENRIRGSVYRGIFMGDNAAVKVMEGDVSGEINILKQINHSNIIRLSGFCVHQGNTYLVYEYVDNGSLHDWLFSKKNDTKDSVLDWKHRVQIAYDVSDALNYLHNFITPPYIHKNLKSSNVLLDSRMRAKIANFGLARSFDEDEDEALQMTRHVIGTYGYMPPEYINNGLITPKMDVYALGVLLLELLSGREAASQSGDVHEKKNEEENEKGKEMHLLSATIVEVFSGENVREKLEGFMDPRLNHEYPLELAHSMAQLARDCVSADLNARPSVTEVFVTISKILSSSLDWDPI